VDGDELPLSREFLATMLGVRRAGITVAVGQLREAGLIASRGGRFSILSRRGLEASACGRYRGVKKQYERLLSSPQPV
jgi:DNA-binding transcriptional regulator YhcF (GntR family)